MAEVINLNKARKARARIEAAATAETNRARHGRTKAEKTRAEADAERLGHILDGHRRDPEGEGA